MRESYGGKGGTAGKATAGEVRREKQGGKGGTAGNGGGGQLRRGDGMAREGGGVG
jgi:hypothetical protein